MLATLKAKLGIVPWETILAIGLIFCAVAFVFWHHVSGKATFIGDSDRLNSYLNVRLAEYDALKEQKRVPNWDTNMFGGFSVAALHWMNPGTDPVGFLLQLFPRDKLFRVLGYVTITLVWLSGVTAYFYIRDVAGTGIPTITAAIAYALSVFSLHRAAQVDNAHMTIVLIPLGLLAIRRATPNNLLWPFLVLASCMTALTYWGFLQEVGYALLFWGFYAVYRAGSIGRSSFRGAAAPLLVLAIAAIVALTFGAPRIITVGQELSLLSRTQTFHYTDFSEIARFLHEGLLGRYHGEARQLGNGLNLHEGLQLVSSTMLSLFVVLGILRPSNRREAFGALLFLSIFLLLLAETTAIYARLTQWFSRWSFALVAMICNALVIYMLLAVAKRCEPFLKMRRGLSGLLPIKQRPFDVSFHVLALVAILMAVLIVEARRVVYYLFGQADFHHSRLSVLGVLPLCTLFAVYLSELKFLRYGQPSSELGARPSVQGLLWFPLPFILLAALIHGNLLDPLFTSVVPTFHLSTNKASPVVLGKVLLTAGCLLYLVVMLFILVGRRRGIVSAVVLAIAAFVAIETAIYGGFKIRGPHTWSFPIAFKDNNYMNVLAGWLEPPPAERLLELRKRLETDSYRSVLLSDPEEFPSTNAPHISEFWQIRMLSGYGTGVPQRLSDMPWNGVSGLRTIEFTSLDQLDQSLLSLLNVKYIVDLSNALYYNKELSGKHSTLGTEASIGGLKFGIIENTARVVPRHFLSSRVTGVSGPPTLTQLVGGRETPMGLDGRSVSGGGVMLTWTTAGPHDALRQEIYRKRLGSLPYPLPFFSLIGEKVTEKEVIRVESPGRSVAIQLLHSGYLALAEVEVMGCAIAEAPCASGALNLARRGAVRQSSTANDSRAERAIDGNLDGDAKNFSVSHTNAEASPWWTLDLGGLYFIQEIRVYNRTDCCADQLANTLVTVTTGTPEGADLSPLQSAATLDPTTRSLLDSRQTPGIHLAYFIRSCNDRSCTPFAQPITVTISDDRIPPVSTAVKSQKANQFQISAPDLPSGHALVVEYRHNLSVPYRQLKVGEPGATTVLFTIPDNHDFGFVRTRVCRDVGCSSHGKEHLLTRDDATTYLLPQGDSTIFVDQKEPLTQQSLAEGFSGTKTFDADGALDARYNGDVIDIALSSSDRERFLVVNQLFHPKWKAYVGSNEIHVYPTNLVMMGFVVPPKVSRLTLRFEPFSTTGWAVLLMAGALAILAIAVLAFRLAEQIGVGGPVPPATV